MSVSKYTKKFVNKMKSFKAKTKPNGGETSSYFIPVKRGKATSKSLFSLEFILLFLSLFEDKDPKSHIFNLIQQRAFFKFHFY